MENGFNNLALTTSFQNIQGSNKYKVRTLDFDTCGDCCNITACDGGIIQVCAKIHFKEGFVIDDLCIEGDLGCKALIVETGAANGIKFSPDSCATPVVTETAIMEDNFGLNIIAPVPTAGTNGQLNISANNRITIEQKNPTGDIEIKIDSTVASYMYISSTAAGAMNMNFLGFTGSITGLENIQTMKINGLRVSPPIPVNSQGVPGDRAGEKVFTQSYIYYCYLTYTGGANPIWNRTHVDDTGFW